MSRKNKSAEIKTSAQTKAPKTPGKAPKTPEVSTTEPEVIDATKDKDKIVTQVITKPEEFVKKTRTLSPDAQVMALNLVHKTMVEPQDPALQFPTEVKRTANNIVAIGSLCALAEHSANGDDSFAFIMQKSGYSGLIEAAAALGYTLPDIKALPTLEGGQVKLEAKAVEIPKEAKEQLKKENEIRKGQAPELDPEKITSEEDLKKALEYKILDKKYRLVDIITDGIEFMRKFRLHEASLAENAEQAKAKFESRNSGDWLDDMFSYVKPSVFFSGIGRGMANVTKIEKSPIHAFTIFRDAIKNKEGIPALEDQEIAYCVKSIVKWVCNANIESNKKAVESMDAKKNAKEIDLCNKQIESYKDIIDYITAPNADEVTNLLKDIGSHFDEGGTLTPECQSANTTFNRICKSYYNKNLSTSDYKNLDTNIQQYGFHIINLFRDPGEQLMDCGLTNISELEERSQEEREELIKAMKKEWAEQKKTEKKDSEKNA